MTTKLRTIFLIGGTALAVAGFFAPNLAAQPKTETNAPPVLVQDAFPDPVVARAKGFEIKRSQLDDAVVGLKANLAGQGRVLTPPQQAFFEQQVLDGLIQVQVLLARATEADRAKGREISDKQFETVRQRAPSEEALSRQLKARGLTVEVFRARMTDEATGKAVAERELAVDIGDEQAKKFYTDNPSKFEQPESVRASHILLATRDSQTGAELSGEKKAAKRKQMEELLKRARAGEDFAKLAKEFSEDPGSKDKGGEYTFPRGQMTPEFEAATFSLNTNQISDIVTTRSGYSIIKLSEKIPARVEPFTTAGPKIKEYLASQERGKQFPVYMEKLKRDAGLEILDESLKGTNAVPTL